MKRNCLKYHPELQQKVSEQMLETIKALGRDATDSYKAIDTSSDLRTIGRIEGAMIVFDQKEIREATDICYFGGAQ
jgi:hypothetical protein